MVNGEERFLPRNLNTWVQTIGIVGAAAWGVYAFYETEYRIPRTAPVNITLDIQLKRSGIVQLGAKASGSNRLLAIEMTILAKNPSSRSIYLLPSEWHVYGIRLNNEKDIDDKKFNEDATKAMNIVGCENYEEKYATTKSSELIVIGQIFRDEIYNLGKQ